MSNEFAIAAVTLTLRDMLDTEISRDIPPPLSATAQIEVTTLPLAKLGKSGKNEINIFLYNASVNAAWANRDMPTTRAGESGFPPLALNLDYLVAAIGESENELLGQVLLGQAMRVLHDNAIIAREKIRMPDSGVPRQIERITITPRPLSVDETSKLWTSLQAAYRVSAAYTATVVLIESRQPARSALPVLRRGEDDRGVIAATTPPPVLAAARPPRPFVSARLGDDVTIEGQHLSGVAIEARLQREGVNEPVVVVPEAGTTSERLVIRLPNDAAAIDRFAAGVNALFLVIERPELDEWPTNAVPLPIAPRITVTPANVALSGDPDQIIELQVSATPRVHDRQELRLIFGSAQIAPVAPPAVPASSGDPSVIAFRVPPVAGSYVVRLRVDGIDSIPVIVDGGGIMQFDPNQTVTLA